MLRITLKHSEPSNEDTPGEYAQRNQLNEAPKEDFKKIPNEREKEMKRALNGTKNGKIIEIINNTKVTKEIANIGKNGCKIEEMLDGVRKDKIIEFDNKEIDRERSNTGKDEELHHREVER